VLTFEQIKELLELVSGRGLGSLEIERSGFRLRIDAKTQGPAPSAEPAARAASEHATAAMPAPPAPQVAHAAPALVAAVAPAAAAPVAVSDAHVLTSPIVGTFYGSPSPDAAAFVAVGDRVRKGQVVCIVEAMKLMNEIESDVDGVVAEIFPKNAQPVEFGEPLFAIRVS
jgi:acetyl-CoA carboxylase biotin carboxyl carrier protein